MSQFLYQYTYLTIEGCHQISTKLSKGAANQKRSGTTAISNVSVLTGSVDLKLMSSDIKFGKKGKKEFVELQILIYFTFFIFKKFILKFTSEIESQRRGE